METIKEVSDMIQFALYQIGAIGLSVYGLLGVIKLLRDQYNQMFGE